jgi:hypothetical protein
MNVFQIVVFTVVLLGSLANAKNSTAAKPPKAKFEYTKKSCEDLKKRTNSGRVCTIPGCPGFNHCVQKKLISVKKIKFTPSKKKCKNMMVEEVLDRYKKSRATFKQNCRSAGCQYFNACRQFKTINGPGKTKNGTGKA